MRAATAGPSNAYDMEAAKIQAARKFAEKQKQATEKMAKLLKEGEEGSFRFIMEDLLKVFDHSSRKNFRLFYDVDVKENSPNKQKLKLKLEHYNTIIKLLGWGFADQDGYNLIQTTDTVLVTRYPGSDSDIERIIQSKIDELEAFILDKIKNSGNVNLAVKLETIINQNLRIFNPNPLPYGLSKVVVRNNFVVHQQQDLVRHLLH
uniref:Uncharacterized protein n=1 Tax=viral metagenome TaxID=1070528 RepID=A0A6C0KWJ4_9ZZZZ